MATQSSTAFTALQDDAAAGRDLGTKLRTSLGEAPDAIIVFASSRFGYEEFLGALAEACEAPDAVIVGSSSAGEFVRGQAGEGTACALALCSTDMVFTKGLGRGVGHDRAAAAKEAVRTLGSDNEESYPYRTALVMTDALAGDADELVEQLVVATAGGYQFAGGGAGDDAQFSKTHVFSGTEAHTDAVVVLSILSSHPVGIGVGHGWTPASNALRVTETDGARLVSLNGVPSVEAFAEHAARTGQTFDQNEPLPFFLHNILGIDSGAGIRLRVPLSLQDDGSITCAAELPLGAKVYIMKTENETAIAAAARATASAVQALHGAKPGAALFFDCVATRLRMGDDFGVELDAVADTLQGAKMVGCNTYGQIARAEGQLNGFHNCTAVVLVIPQ